MGYVWKKGDESVRGVLECDESGIVTITAKHSAKGQWGDAKDGSATVLSFRIDMTKLVLATLRKWGASWWIINHFRRNSGILDMAPADAIKELDGKTFVAGEDFVPPESSTLTPDEKAINALVKAGFPRDAAEKLIANKDKTLKLINK
jgi:hypothetical protein